MATNMKEFLFAGMITGEITCFNSLTLTNIGTWNAHTSVVTSLVCVSDNILWSGSDSGEISIWEFQVCFSFYYFIIYHFNEYIFIFMIF